MSLTIKQQEDTHKELTENLLKSGLSIQTIANDLQTTEEYIEDLIHLFSNRVEDVWILRNYLIKKVQENGETITEFTALDGDWRNYWFLDTNYIDDGIIESYSFSSIEKLP